MTSVAVNGAQGKMGRISCEAIDAAPNLELVATLGRHDNLQKTLAQLQPDVVLEFTLPECAYANTQCIIEQGACPVIGTSGLTLPEIQSLTELAQQKKQGGLIAPNFSIAAILMMQFAEKAARFLPEAAIIEMHHEEKVDAPSGTARRTAEMLKPHRPQSHKSNDTQSHHYQGTPIHSVRLPGLFAHQAVVFGGPGETLTIKHDAIDRGSMMNGVVLACEQVIKLDTLHYGLEHILSEVN